MGIDYDGGMIVGESGGVIVQNLKEGDDIFDLIDKHAMSKMSQTYDCDIDDCFVGFQVDDVNVSDIEEYWLSNVKRKAKMFEEITGIPAKLIGTQDIW